MSRLRDTRRARQAGIGLIELMVALVLSLFLLAGLFTIFFSTKRGYNDQQGLAALQDNQLLAASVLANTVRAAGYFPYNTTTLNSRAAAFPAAGATWAAGQVIYATGTTQGPDNLYIRLIPTAAVNCLGANSTAAQVNEFSLLNTTASPHSLACNVNSAPRHALVSPLGTTGFNPNGGGVQNMQVRIGVAAAGGTDATTYLAPSAMTAADWTNARIVIVTLSFYNPLFDAAHTPAGSDTDAQGQPRYLRMTRVIRLENLS